jgi:acetylornithine deacetylase/succinyl-diaminopimelate desuccinylase-like protein
MTTAYTHAKGNADSFLQQLDEWLRIPSVSTLPERVEDMHEAAQWLVNNMTNSGIENVKIMPTDGHPVVYGDWLHAGSDAVTVLVYGHYDVQPAVIEDGWDSDPFIPTKRGGRIYARGVSDDKGQLFVHVKTVESLLQTDGKLPVNIKFLFEGEEEIGSPNLGKFLRTNKDKFAADVCVISDGGIVAEDQPSITYSLRGLAALEVTIFGPSQDLHSGSYGGAVHNPLQALAKILSQLHNDDGSIAVPGFYDNVQALDDKERDELKKTNPTETEWQKVAGVPQSWGEPDFTIQERLGARPTLEINGFIGGFSGKGVKTVLPAKASAKITCRLVANQDPQRITNIIADYITQITPPSVRSEILKHQGGFPSLIDTNLPIMDAAITAYKKGWGKPPIFVREGGSIPIVADFQQVLDLPVLLLGFGLNSDNPHGPNEGFVIDLFYKALDTAICFLYEAAKIK